MRFEKVIPINDRGNSWIDNKRIIAFVYQQNDKFCLRGTPDEIEQTILASKKPSIVHFVRFSKYTKFNSWTYVEFFNFTIPLYSTHGPEIPTNNGGSVYRGYNIVTRKTRFDRNVLTVHYVKRFPRKWIKELDRYV